MAIQVVALGARAAAAAGRKAALSAARKGKQVGKGVKERFKRRFARKGVVKEPAEGEAPAEETKIPWLEIIFVVLVFALPNDLLDLLELTGIGKIATIILDFVSALALWLWFLLRVGESPNKKLLKFVIAAIGEFTVLGLLPLWTILVINVRLRIVEKIAGLFTGAK